MAEEAKTDSETATAQNGRRKRRRVLWLSLLFIIFIGTGAAYAAYWYLVGQYFVSTDDAYVEGNQVRLMPQITGTVTAIHAEETDLVHEGQPLVDLDGTDVRIALQRAKARLADTVRGVRQLYKQESEQEATIKIIQVRLAQAQRDYKRDQRLLKVHGASREQFQHARTALHSARYQLAQARDKLAELKAMTEGTDLRHNPRVELAVAALRKAYLDVERTTLIAPVTGYVARRGVQVGQKVEPGNPLMAIVPLNQIWVDANFKETDLSRLRIGQPVDVTSDLYGNSVHYEGKVAGISPGTGSAFELIPPQNATGNWIKVVRRVPVRITLDPKELEDHPLRLGLSLEATVDVHDTHGLVLAKKPAHNSGYSTDVYRRPQTALDRLIERIVRENAGPAFSGSSSAQKQDHGHKG